MQLKFFRTLCQIVTEHNTLLRLQAEQRTAQAAQTAILGCASLYIKFTNYYIAEFTYMFRQIITHGRNAIAQDNVRVRREIFSCLIRHFLLSYKIVFICSEQFFITKFVTDVTKFLTCVTKFVMLVTNFVIKNVL